MKLILLDRDGVINEDSPDFIKSLAEWRPIAGSLEAIARLCHAGYRVCIASNQSGLGRGLFDYDAFAAINVELQKRLAVLGGRIEAVAFAPEHPDDATHLRKPNPGMLNDLARRMGVSLDGVWMVGDSAADVLAARAAGAVPVLVRTGNGAAMEQSGEPQAAWVFDDLAGAVQHLLQQPH